MLSLDDDTARGGAATPSGPLDGPGALRHRLYQSLDSIPVVTPERREVMHAWLEYLMRAQTSDDPALMAMAVRGDRTRLTWTVLGHIPTLTNAMHEVFAALEVDEREQALLLDVLLTVEPSRLGTWLEVSQRGFDGGWSVHAPIPLARAVRWAPALPAVGQLLVWAERAGVAGGTHLRRSVSRTNPYTQLCVPVPPTAGAPLEHALSALSAAMGIDDGRSVAAALRGMGEPSRAAITLRLSTGGPALGVRISGPSDQMLDHLLSSHNGAARAALRGFEHALGAALPRAVLAAAAPGGLDVELHYTPYPMG